MTIPTVTLHAIDDPTAFVEHESAYRATREGAGTADLLVQAFSRESEHSSLSNCGYAAVMDALATGWRPARPTPAGIAATCPTFDARTAPAASSTRPSRRDVRLARRAPPGRPALAGHDRRPGAGLVADPGHRHRAMTRG